RHKFQLNTVFENGMSVALKAMTVSGHGVAWIPEGLVADELKRGVLVRAGDMDADLVVDIRVYRTPQFRNRHAERFWRRASQLAM
ncbi:LysR substrate-binding domain-containing protein, partial [Escherichia coli]|nr:LysR substrate-binding domain-containing protein [Escherichia coli]